MQYTTSSENYRKLLNRDLHLAVWYGDTFWSKFTGKIGGGEGSKYDKTAPMGMNKLNMKPTGMPIEYLEQFKAEGSVTMGIPVFYPLTGVGVSGDTQLLGKEEQIKFANIDVYINQKRHGVVKFNGKYSKQTLQKPQIQAELVTKAQDKLKDWFRRYVNYQPYNAITRGFSEHLFNSGDGGPGLTQKSHPNFFVAGSGKATWSDTPATYETNVGTALSGLTNTANDYFSTKVIQLMVYEATQLRIPRVQMAGGDYYIIVISGSQAYQLLQDSEWKTAQQYAGVLGDENRVFTNNLIGLYAGAFIYVDDSCPGAKISGDTGYDSTIGTINYGVSNPLASPIDTNATKKLAILLGKSAVACGVADPLGIDEESWDYKNKETVGASMIYGMCRTDIYDKDGYFGTANLFKENTSSLVCATYSPTAVSWS